MRGLLAKGEALLASQRINEAAAALTQARDRATECALAHEEWVAQTLLAEAQDG